MESRLRRSACTVVLLTTAAFTVLFVTWFHLRFGLNSPPSATGDEPSYDAIGWQLAQGNGFREDVTDPVFRRPYDEAAVTNPELMTLADIRSGTVTYRPPLFPFLIAATDIVFGRQFAAVRILNVLAITLSGALVVRYLLTDASARTAFIGMLLFFVIDVRTRLYARAILTEAIAVLLVTLLTLQTVRLCRTRRLSDACVLGILCGLAMLNRSAFVLWWPGLALGILLLTGREDNATVPIAPETPTSFRRRVLLVTTMLLTTAVVYAPWAVRNTLILGKFMPMGTQGMMELSAAFSDKAVERQGLWFNQASDGFYEDVDQPGMTRIEQELARSAHSRRTARAWIAAHPQQALALVPTKILQEYRPRSATEWLILICSVTGIIRTRRNLMTKTIVLLHLCNAFLIGCTWSVEGRFIVPLLFGLHVTAAQAFVPGRNRAD
ncbi:MAG: glycosyltransferase family 39 protein [Planctomycetaceae bacterium]|nr:glycosyltransferase family 39 protein [Planctomycetaceae bacterium]